MSVKMRSLKPHYWDGVTLQPGTEFESTEDHAKIIETLGWAERIDAQSTRRPRAQGSRQQRDMRAGPGFEYETKDGSI